MANKTEQAIETLAKYLFDIYGKSGGKVYNKKQRVIWETEARMLLRFFKEANILPSLGYVKKAKDQTLPEYQYERGTDLELGHLRALEMVRKANFVKVEEEMK